MQGEIDSIEFNEFDVAMEAAVEEHGSREHRRILRRRPHLRKLATVLAVQEWEREVLGGARTLSEGDTPIIDFLKWLIENPEKLAAFIQLIIGLFSGLAVTGE